MAEARFLAARAQRLEQLSNNRSSSRTIECNKEELVQFERNLRAWNSDLLYTTNNNDNHNNHTLEHESEQRQALSDLTTRLGQLRTTVLEYCDQLSDVQVRTVYQKLTEATTKLTMLKQSLPYRFVFTRYRAALRNQSMQSKKDRAPPLSTTTATTTKTTMTTTPVQVFDETTTIHHHQHTTILVQADGTVLLNNQISTQKKLSSTNKTNDTGACSCVLRDMHHCTIRLEGDYVTVHVTNVHDCCLTIPNPVSSSVHMQNVTHTNVETLHCHQLRLHDTRHVRFGANTVVHTGCILEGCSGLHFAGSIAIRDFDWLRTDAPSPNYSIVDNYCPHAKDNGMERFPSPPSAVSSKGTVRDGTRRPVLPATRPNVTPPLVAMADVVDNDDDEL